VVDDAPGPDEIELVVVELQVFSVHLSDICAKTALLQALPRHLNRAWSKVDRRQLPPLGQELRVRAETAADLENSLPPELLERD
jgi:hypothetical protein